MKGGKGSKARIDAGRFKALAMLAGFKWIKTNLLGVVGRFRRSVFIILRAFLNFSPSLQRSGIKNKARLKKKAELAGPGRGWGSATSVRLKVGRPLFGKGFPQK